VPSQTRSAPGHDGPELERSVTLTDAVVAIAMTLLVLPLVEIARDADTEHLGAFLADNRDLFLSFAISFFVIYAFWSAHGGAFRIFAAARDERAVIRTLNMWWLLLVVFLPFPTAVVGRDLNTTTAPLYIGTMVLLSALTSGMIVLARRDNHRPPRARWAWLTTAIFALCTVLSMFNADLGTYALLLLAVVRVLEVRVLRLRSAD
jgi:uncharacterized membrane protein